MRLIERFIQKCDEWTGRLEKRARQIKSESQAKVLVYQLVSDGIRYRQLFDSGMPIAYMGTEYEDKASLDAAIDRDIAQEGKAS